MFNIRMVHIKNMCTIRPRYFLSDPKTWQPSRDPWHTAPPHSGGIRSSTGLTTAKLKWQTQQTLPHGRKIYLQPLLARPHSPGQPGFHISQEQIGWNSQHHSTLVNEGRMASSSSTGSLHGRGRWLTAVILVTDSFTLCYTGEKTLAQWHMTQTTYADQKHAAVRAQPIHHLHTWPQTSQTGNVAVKQSCKVYLSLSVLFTSALYCCLILQWLVPICSATVKRRYIGCT